MTSFKKKKPKVNMTVRVDPDILKKCKRKGLNLSGICGKALELAVDGKFTEDSTAI